MFGIVLGMFVDSSQHSLLTAADTHTNTSRTHRPHANETTPAVIAQPCMGACKAYNSNLAPEDEYRQVVSIGMVTVE